MVYIVNGDSGDNSRSDWLSKLKAIDDNGINYLRHTAETMGLPNIHERKTKEA